MVEKSKASFRTALQKSSKQENHINVFILETATNSVELYRWINEGNPTENELLFVLFQIFYTLKCFNRIGLRYNDLHFGNIFIKKNIKGRKSSSEIFKFVVDNNSTFTISANYIPLIYDWNRGCVPGLLNNSFLDSFGLCYHIGECNKPNPKYDTAKVLCKLSKIITRDKSNRYPSIKEFSEEVISPTLINHIDQSNNYCFLRLPTGGDFVPVSKLEEMYNPFWCQPTIDIINHPIFHQFKQESSKSHTLKATFTLPKQAKF
jgi:hypothetical protein